MLDGLTLSLPDVDLLPDQPPDAAQLSASVVDQLNNDEYPSSTVGGFALKLNVGAGTAALTVTVTLSWVLPPAPAQVSVKPVVPDGETLSLPCVERLPDQPPEAVQLSASVVDQPSREAPPSSMAVGSAVNVTVGAGVEPSGKFSAVSPKPPGT